MKKFNKLLCFMVVFITVMAALCTVSFAATVGQQLTSPEFGWQRIDDKDVRIKYIGSDTNISVEQYSSMYNQSQHWLKENAQVKFNFYGSKLRLITYGDCYNYTSFSVDIFIDGIKYTHSQFLDRSIWQALITEISGLELRNHSVIVCNSDPNNPDRFGIDAIDIDATGYLIDIDVPNSPTNLTAAPGNTKVNLSWNAVEAATSYNVKRSETLSGPYQTIATTTTGAITYSDTGLQNGTTYYYAVSAVNAGGESPNSNEVSVTPTAPQPINQLKLVLEVNQEKQLSVSGELSDNTEMDWISSDQLIATVDSNGKVKALKPGNTLITCTSKDNLYTESINVLVVDLEYQLAVDLSIGGTCKLTIDDLANTTFATWSSHNPAIAAVSAKGKVTAVSEGLTYVVASDKDGNEIGRIYVRVRL